MKKIKPSTQKYSTLTWVLVVILIISGAFLYRSLNLKKLSLAPSVTEHKVPGVILSAKTTKGLDPKTGSGLDEVTSFAVNDPVIYLALTVNKPVKGTNFEYTRYFNGSYVDHGSLKTNKDGVSYISFSWKLKNTSSKRLAGDYLVKLYTNGNYEKEVTYSVR